MSEVLSECIFWQGPGFVEDTQGLSDIWEIRTHMVQAQEKAQGISPGVLEWVFTKADQCVQRLATVSSSSPDVYGLTTAHSQRPPTLGLTIPSPCMDLINMLWFPAVTAEVRGTPPHQIPVSLSMSLYICLHSHVTVSRGSGTQVSRVAVIWVHCPKKTYYSHNTILKAQETQHSG